MTKKIDRKLNGEDIVEKEFGDFLENGGSVGGRTTFNQDVVIKDINSDNTRIRFVNDNGNFYAQKYGQNTDTFLNELFSVTYDESGNNKSFNIGDVSRTTNGYTKLPNGLILQWGIVNLTVSKNPLTSVTANVNFPVAFTTSIFLTGVFPRNNVTTMNHGYLTNINAISRPWDRFKTYIVANAISTMTADYSVDFNWFAIGY